MCERAAPGTKQVFLWDARCRGFCLRITPQRLDPGTNGSIKVGGSKSFWLKLTRTLTGSDGKKTVRATWVRIGSFMAGHQEDLTVEVARKRAEKLKDAHEQGQDVRAMRTEQKNPDDLAKLAQIYLADHAFTDLRESSQKSIRSYLNNHILPTLGKRYVRDLTNLDMRKLYAQVRKDTSIVTANRVIALMSVLIGFAVEQGMRPDGKNPCSKLKKTEVPRERVLSRAELKKLGEVLGRAEANWSLKPKPKNACLISPVAADALRFLATTGLRLGEVLPLKWGDVDLDNATMRFANHKTSKKSGTKRLPIPPVALQILKLRKAACEASDKKEGKVKELNPFVFRGQKAGGHLIGLERIWLRVREEIGLGTTSNEGEARLHDLRRTYHSTCVELGFGKMIGDLLLGHSIGRVHDAYTNISTVGILLQAATDVSNWIQAAMAGFDPEIGKKIPASIDRTQA